MMNYRFFLFSFILMAAGGASRYESLLNKTYAERYDEIVGVYKRAVVTADSVSAFEEVNMLKALAIRHGDIELALEVDLLKVYYLTLWHKDETEAIEKNFRELVEKAVRHQSHQINVRAHKVLGDYYWFGLNNYELGFETYINLEQLLRKISIRALPDKVYPLQNMAQAYHNFSDYPKALQLFRQIVALEEDNDKRGGKNSALYSIGMIHRQLGNLDSSDYYYHEIVEDSTSRNYATWKGIAYGGLGYNCFLRKEYDKAVPFLESERQQALKDGDYGLAASSLITLAEICLTKNNPGKAEQYALQARKYLSAAEPERYRYYQDLYPVLSKVYAMKGSAMLAGHYLDSAIFAKDSMSRQFNAMQMMRARQKIELQEHRAEIEKADMDRRLNIMERNILLLIVLLTLLLSGYLFYDLRRRHRQKQLRQALELRRKEEELDHAKRQLQEFAKNIQEKTRLIEYLESRRGPGADTGILSQLRESTILTQEGWEHFKKLFEQVHAGYLYRLKQKFPDLTPAEIRLIALVKLGLGYQDMASILGVSGQAVRTTKYRLLKKIDLAGDMRFEALIADI